MSISDEHDLTGRLDQAFQAITPRRAPVDQAVRHGTVIRVRRRIAVVAGLAVVAAGIAVPALLHQQARQPVLNQPRHHDVTVHPAGRHAPAGLIASGTVDGRRWRVTADKPGTGGAAPGAQCFTAVTLHDCGPVTAPTRSGPVAFMGTSNGPTDAAYGPVSAAVSYLTVRLADGPALTLHPVSVYGTRYVAFAAPVHVAIRKITAYSARGELASAIPFNGPDGSATVGLWLRPGQTGLRRATQVIGSGRTGSRAWSVTAYLGPWGECLVTRGGGGTSSGCNPVPSPQGTMVLGSASGSPGLVYGSASADVEHMVITLAGGGTIRVRAILVGDQKFFAFAHGQGQHSVRWQAYDASRREVGSGRFRGL
ncbi:MAG: hypothetical protein QOG05_1750 [Streptosporangiaceae bacterium]|jgi:hypothetical protein|nr:hypothetical protein [Streptosporangiaceae bacterium]